MGKSTVCTKVLAAVDRTIGGFYTVFRHSAKGQRTLHLCRAGCAPIFQQDSCVAWFRDGIPEPYPEQFDKLGVKYLNETENDGVELILMDELGFLERDASAFRQAVLRILEGNIPVLGVLRKGFPGWTDEIARHPDVRVVEVTKENRNRLPQQVRELLIP